MWWMLSTLSADNNNQKRPQIIPLQNIAVARPPYFVQTTSSSSRWPQPRWRPGTGRWPSLEGPRWRWWDCPSRWWSSVGPLPVSTHRSSSTSLPVEDHPSRCTAASRCCPGRRWSLSGSLVQSSVVLCKTIRPSSQKDIIMLSSYQKDVIIMSSCQNDVIIISTCQKDVNFLSSCEMDVIILSPYIAAKW